MALEGKLYSLLAAIACLSTPLQSFASIQQPVRVGKAELNERLLLQVSYEQENGHQDFMTSRSRIVRLVRKDDALRLVEEPETPGISPRVLATIPVEGETANALLLDFNAGFDKIYSEEDRTGEDYYGRIDKQDYTYFRLSDRRVVSVDRDGPTLVVNQEALNEGGESILVHYYLSPYRPNPEFETFEMKSLDHFGFYETYPQRRSRRTVLYAMKFDAHKPIVFALSAQIPELYRQAVRDGALYWNKALGRPLIRVIDAPEGVTAPDPRYNVIQWVSTGAYATTAHIQSDPLTGEILHAHIFILSRAAQEGDLEEQRDHLRYIAAHEVGHALGLRHDFAMGPVSTVMNYFSFDRTVRIGRDVILAGGPALEYDRKVIRHVYLGEPLDVETLPAFCTDNQRGCSPFPMLSDVRRAATPR